MERTFAILKPDTLQRNLTEEIKKRITDSGLYIIQEKETVLSKDKLREHYKHIADKPFYPPTEEYMTSGNVILLEIEGENAISKLRTLIGATVPKFADKGTIRGDLGLDFGDIGIVKNLIHASDSVESYKKEYKLWFD